MSQPDSSSHPSQRDLYTPLTPELTALFKRMRDEHGSWRKVAALTGTRMKVLRNIRKKRKCVSLTVLDRMCSGTRVGSVSEFPWFTADDLVRLGIWDPPLRVEGSRRILGGEEWEVL